MQRVFFNAFGIFCSTLCFLTLPLSSIPSRFIIEYIYFENVHLFTYDLFAEKLGFKLIWGCLLFYPFFYPIGVWALVPSQPAYGDLGPAAALLTILLFFSGWFLTRGANLQKYYFKVRLTAMGVVPLVKKQDLKVSLSSHVHRSTQTGLSLALNRKLSKARAF